MKSNNTLRFLYILLFLLCIIPTAFSQSKKQQQLEIKRKNILKEIKEINALIADNKSEKSTILSKIEEADLKIKIQKKLIQINNQQANLLTKEIKENKKKITELESELIIKKKKYADMIVKSYKNRATDSKIMFLLSADNFQQAYKRYNYMKQYKRYQKKQADTIAFKTEKLSILNESLLIKKEDKIKIIKENKKTQEKLLNDKKAQNLLIAEIKKDEAKYKKEIAEKQKANDAIDRQIEELIKQAIAKANKKANKNNNNTKKYALTPEAKALAKNFTANKGKLPWPVKTGRVIEKFGTSKHPTQPNITRRSSGVKIITSKNSDVTAVFNGTIYAIQKIKGGNIAVFIEHGNYYTIYQNLKNLYVRKGQKVKTNSPIGKVAENIEGKSIFKFLIWKDGTKQNPAHWIYKM